MGWKSTIDMTRKAMEEAVQAKFDVEGLSDEELSELMELFMGGEEHGHNYRVVAGKTQLGD